jgi:hypothetical protein
MAGAALSRTTCFVAGDPRIRASESCDGLSSRGFGTDTEKVAHDSIQIIFPEGLEKEACTEPLQPLRDVIIHEVITRQDCDRDLGVRGTRAESTQKLDSVDRRQMQVDEDRRGSVAFYQVQAGFTIGCHADVIPARCQHRPKRLGSAGVVIDNEHSRPHIYDSPATTVESRHSRTFAASACGANGFARNLVFGLTEPVASIAWPL